MTKHFNNQKGVALIVTLGIVAVLLMAALQSAKFIGNSFNVIQIEKKRFQAEQLALSGINIAIMLLVEDATKDRIDSLQEIWANREKLSYITDALGLEKERLVVKITDELSKIQVNALISEYPGHQFNQDQVKLWENLLRLLISKDNAMNKKMPEEIINSIKDWLDSGDDETVTGFSGAESDYYLSLEFPYDCANGPFNHIDEFLMVKSFPPKLLTFDRYNKTDQQDIEKSFGDVFTVYGLDIEKTKNNGFRYTGAININTADIEILAALLPEGKEMLAYNLAEFRTQKTNSDGSFTNSLESGWYKKVIHLSDAEQNRIDRMIRYSTNIFKIESIAQQNDIKIVLTAFVQREQDRISKKWRCRILHLERE